jgi:hypothetical protein
LLTPQEEPRHPFQEFIYLWLAPCLVVVLPVLVLLLGWLTGHSAGWLIVCPSVVAVGMVYIVWPEIPQAIYEFTHFPFGMIFDHDTELWWYRLSGFGLLAAAIFIGWRAW